MARSDTPEGAAPADPNDSMDVFRVEPTDDPSTIALVGELDIAGIPALSKAIATATPRTNGLTFDLARLTFIDSSGLNELLKALRQDGGPIRLMSPQPNVLRVLDIAGVLSAFEVVDGQPGDPD